MAALRITASPYDGSWFFDTRQLGALWAGLLRWDGTFVVEVISYEGGPHPCTVASDAWLVLDEFESDLRNLADQLVNGPLTGSGFDAELRCPDSLMIVGQNCLDFFISAPTALLLLAGDNRDTNPYATLSQSKVWILDDFNNNRISIMLSGSIAYLPIAIINGYPTVQITGFPADPAGQITYVRVDSVDANTRTLEIKIENAMCPAYESMMAQRFPGGMIPASILHFICPKIDAKIRYVRDGDSWRVSDVVRDAYPNVDVIRKMPDGTLEAVSQSRNRTGGAFWLIGLWKLIYDVQSEKDRLMQELSSQGCNLE